MRKYKVLTISLIVVTVDILAVFLHIYCEKFYASLLYPRINLSASTSTLFWFLLPILIIELLVALSVFLIRKKRTAEVIIAIIILIAVVPFVYLFLNVSFAFGDKNWESRTTNIENFGTIDEYAEVVFECNNPSLWDELSNFSKEEVTDYKYVYYLGITNWVELNISYTVEVSDSKFESFFSMLNSKKEFIIDGDSEAGVVIYDKEKYRPYYDAFDITITYNNVENTFTFDIYCLDY